VASKRHHFVPETYLKRFADESGHVYGYRKDDPTKPLYQLPRELGHERYYYAQPMPDGSRDTDRLEQLFSQVEAAWDAVATKAVVAADVNDDLESIMTFLALMRVRGPAMRDAIEVFMAQSARATLKHLEATGALPPMDHLSDRAREALRPENLEIAVDPHRSLWAMPHAMEGIALVLDSLGYFFVHNETSTDFITSDNPVIYFDARPAEADILPYTVVPGQPIELLFPVSPRLLLIGHTDFRARFELGGMWHSPLKEVEKVKRVNRLVARFGYRLLFAKDRRHEALVQKYAAQSPVPSFMSGSHGTGQFLLTQMVFGPRPPKPKYRLE